MLTLPSGRSVLALDAIMIAWTIVWVIVGVAVADALGELTRLTGTFRAVGAAVTEVGETLAAVNLPLIGEALDRASAAVGDAGRDIVARGEETRDEIRRAAALIGAAVALIPILSLVMPYAPARAARAAETSALRRLLASGASARDPGLEAFLAQRALTHLPYRRLERVAERPWELEDGDTRRALAGEELRRLGLSQQGLGGVGGTGAPPP
jgi:hypothetical protein